MGNMKSQNLELLPLEKIRIDGGTQSRVSIDEKVVMEYAELLRGGTELPPAVVFFDGEEYWLADGFHRYSACKQLGREQIKAEIRRGSQCNAILFSVGANASHGLRRSNADKRKAVETMLKGKIWQQWSNREIARRCVVSESMVRQIRDSLTAHKMQHENTKRTFVHPKTGKATRMKTNNIGAKTKTDASKPKAPATPSQLLATDPNIAVQDIVKSMGNDYLISLAGVINTYIEIIKPLSGKSFV